MSFVRAVELDGFGGSAVFKAGRKQILVVEVGGEVHALDNRCPHEGYPLSKGTTDDGACTLTCNWHNWKFRLTDGRCLVGDDNVRVYATKVEDGAIWVDLSPPPREQVVAAIMAGLEKAFREQTYGQLAREVARLHYVGADPLDAVRAGILWSHDRFEYGTTHAYAALPDWLALHAEAQARGDLEAALVPLVEGLDHMAHDALRHPPYPYPAEGRPFDEETFLAAIEAEDAEAACALALGALEAGSGWADLEPLLARAALAHYNDFGHSLIYVYKMRQVLDVLPAREVERALLLALVRSICYASREDLIPQFDAYAPSLARVASGEGPLGEAPDTPYGAPVRRALDWTVAALATRAPKAVHDDLLGASARAMLHFDTAYGTHVDRPVSHNVSWLGFTHAITFGNAVRVQATRQPALWPAGLLQMACFVGRNAAFLDRDLDTAPWMVEDEAAFEADVKARLLDHGEPLPIFSSHLLKTSLAVFEEAPLASDGTRALLLAALNRFLASPLKTKHARRLVHQGIELVARDYAT